MLLTPPVMLWPMPEALASSTIGQLGRCSSSWNFGWYGSSMRILPHRLKNNAIAATQSIMTHMTMNASSVRITIGPVNTISSSNNKNNRMSCSSTVDSPTKNSPVMSKTLFFFLTNERVLYDTLYHFLPSVVKRCYANTTILINIIQ